MKTYSYRQHGYFFFILLITYAFSLPMTAIAHAWKAPPDAAQKINPLQMSEASIQEGRKSYAYHCASCHGKNARGDGPDAKDLYPKPADLLKRLEDHSEGDFFWKVSNGRGDMPGFREQFSDRQIWEVINFIKSLVMRKMSQDAD